MGVNVALVAKSQDEFFLKRPLSDVYNVFQNF